MTPLLIRRLLAREALLLAILAHLNSQRFRRQLCALTKKLVARLRLLNDKAPELLPIISRAEESRQTRQPLLTTVRRELSIQLRTSGITDLNLSRMNLRVLTTIIDKEIEAIRPTTRILQFGDLATINLPDNLVAIQGNIIIVEAAIIAAQILRIHESRRVFAIATLLDPLLALAWGAILARGRRR